MICIKDDFHAREINETFYELMSDWSSILSLKHGFQIRIIEK